jgi:hypothetical protein
MMQFLGLMIAVGAVIGVIMTLLRPHWAFVVVVAMWPLEQLLQAYLPLLGAHRSIVNYSIALLGGLAAVLRLFRREATLGGYFNPVTFLTFCLYVLWAVGILYSPAREVGADGFWFAVAYQLLLMGVLPLLVADMFEFRRMLPGLMVLGSIISMLIILNPSSSYHSGRLYLDLGMIGGGVTNAGNPLALAEMGGLIALVAALARPERKSSIMNIVRAVAFFAGMGLAIGSGSRGQVLAASLSGIVFFPVSRKLANPKQFVLGTVGFAMLVVAILVVFKVFIGAQNEKRWDPVGMLTDTTGRLDMVWNLFSHWLASPSHWLFGLGTFAYASISPDDAQYVHNVAAEMLCEHGVVGAALFVLIAILTVRAGRQLWGMYKDDPSMRATIALLMAICVYFLLQSLKQGSMSYPSPFYWWIILTKLSTHHQKFAPVSDLQFDDYEDQSLGSPGLQTVDAANDGSDGELDADDYALGY